ncbi:uncharacterized protein B0I36DRAFT_382767 [Microdochium trichocladiopsis]|uniref:AA1-like domain-containing protein n=1 Tax=Microdochium trichocladiopsis TaxID=1682393 RepID=A0A9P8YAW6_9PEZI|nr:uncharacterized protein B0I36DRAFT_382767 [Microdochium trichocladiopsis]KAH7032753.1 hypothetical protein B0I36DRAFT_382767 [Microdochium trichocladiopsis]
MQTTTFLALVCGSAAAGNAAAIPGSDPYVGDLRTFGEVGCSSDNQGVATIVLSRVKPCTPYPLAFKSIAIHGFDRWEFLVHTTDDCTDEGTPVQPTAPGAADLVCTSAPVRAAYVAFSIVAAP